MSLNDRFSLRFVQSNLREDSVCLSHRLEPFPALRAIAVASARISLQPSGVFHASLQSFVNFFTAPCRLAGHVRKRVGKLQQHVGKHRGSKILSAHSVEWRSSRFRRRFACNRQLLWPCYARTGLCPERRCCVRRLCFTQSTPSASCTRCCCASRRYCCRSRTSYSAAVIEIKCTVL